MQTRKSNDPAKLAYPFGAAPSDEVILAEVMNALHWHSGVPQDCVAVNVKDGRVTLTGRVEEAFEKQLAEQTAAAAPGVTDVVNEIVIHQSH